MSNDPKYITRLMRIRCSKGTMDNYLNIARDHGVLAGANQEPVMSANDHTKECIIHCGKCQSDENPERMFRKSLVSGILGGPILPAKNILTDFLENVGIMTCKCTPNTPLPWVITNEDNILEGAPALTMDSQCACRYGGVISFVPLDEYPPDNPKEMAEGADNAPDDAPSEDVVGEMFSEALEHAMGAIADSGEAGSAAVEQVQLALAVASAMYPQNAQSSGGEDHRSKYAEKFFYQ